MDLVDSKNISSESGNSVLEEIKKVSISAETETDAKRWTDDIFKYLPGKSKPGADGGVTMPVARDADRYNMNHPTRGKAVIFNHMKFTNGQSTRHGTDKDETNLKLSFQSVGFEVVIHRDLKKLKILQVLDDLREEDHSKADCLVIIVLSHGEQDKIYCSDSDYRPEELWNPFTADRCPTLAGKPKIFFLQACRGDQLDSGTTLSRTQTDSKAVSSQEIKPYTIPNRADFLIVFSTAPGYYSWRNTSEGSWFVQSITKVIEDYKDTKDLLSMMTIVTRVVALDFESNVPNSYMDQKKQVPMITSTLTRDIYL